MVAASQTKEGWRLPFRALVFAGLVLDISGMENENNAPPLTPQEFAHLGAGAVAYVRPVDSEDVQRLFPQAPQLRPGVMDRGSLQTERPPPTKRPRARRCSTVEQERARLGQHSQATERQSSAARLTPDAAPPASHPR
jgi:Protein of unknown function (DUF1150)